MKLAYVKCNAYLFFILNQFNLVTSHILWLQRLELRKKLFVNIIGVFITMLIYFDFKYKCGLYIQVSFQFDKQCTAILLDI